MKVEVSNGELVDKVSILKVKLEKIRDSDKQICINLELMELEPVVKKLGCYTDLLDLQEINDKLWDVIGEAKDLLARGQLGERFADLSAETIRLNDARFLVKKRINRDTGSALREVKEKL